MLERRVNLGLTARAFVVVVLSFLFGGSITIALGADGDLDPTFGTGGVAVTALSSTGSTIYCLALQPDGKIVAAGDAGGDFALVRYNSNGTLDGTFGNGGKVLTSFGATRDVILSLALQPDGKIVAVGSASSSNGVTRRIAIARYNNDGSLDTTFGTNGKKTENGAEASAVVLQPDGKIIVGGRAFVGLSGQHFAVARYNSNGTLDATFGSGGTVTTQFASNSRIIVLRLLVGGRIAAAGWTLNDSYFARYNANGSLDTTYGNGGKVLTTGLGLRAFAFDANGVIIGAGKFKLARYTPNGSSDPAFGNAGVVTTASALNPTSALILPNGKLLFGGEVPGQNLDLAVARYNANGSPDTTFGTAGTVTTYFNSVRFSTGYALAVQPDGKIIAAGMATVMVGNTGYGQFAVARYLSRPSRALPTSGSAWY